VNSWTLYALASAFFAGLTALFGKIGVKDINSNLATFIRTIIILMVTAILLSMRSEWERVDHLNSKTIIFLVLSGITTGLSWMCYYHALKLGPVSKVAPIDKLSFVFAMLLAFIFLGEKVTWQACLGSGLIGLGTLVIIFQ
jgi:transporter family protein